MKSQINDSNGISTNLQYKLINFSKQLFTEKILLPQKEEIKQFINTIDDFIESKDDNTLTKLINIVIKSERNSIIVDNIKLLIIMNIKNY